MKFAFAVVGVITASVCAALVWVLRAVDGACRSIGRMEL